VEGAQGEMGAESGAFPEGARGETAFGLLVRPPARLAFNGFGPSHGGGEGE
jgi:hypothetical protein